MSSRPGCRRSRALQEAASGFRGRDGRRDRLRRLLDAQVYRLVHWRRAAREINYRRFFDVDDLVALHMEDPEVFAQTHALLLEWRRRGWVDGFRIDAAKHIEGFALDYFDRAVYRSSFRTLLNGQQKHIFSFSEVFDGNQDYLQTFVKDNINPADPGRIGGNRDVLDFPLFFALKQNLSGNGFQNDWFGVRNATFDLHDDGMHNGSQGVMFTVSHDEGQPFLVMKLVKGHTLDQLLAERPDPGHDRGRFLTAFEQVCQAVAFAHDRRVVHRDLKPANVMVGAFGEVQVMDWGLAKVLGDGPTAEADPTGGSTFPDFRAGTEADRTQAGGVLGTPAFMPPEQAAGAVELIDRRADVFGLGALLCAI